MERNAGLVRAFKNHIGFYPRASAIAAFKSELTPFKTSKGAIQLAIDEPIPIDLIKKVVKFRIGEDRRKHTSAVP
jgi:uncharacterized protein YdhG (YjbR/CyaY superfamily)